MRFHLVDRIIEVNLGGSLKAIKNLTLGEEYLADHFPTFPVMPGVLMLQTLVEAGTWLIRLTDDFRHSVIVLREARNVKYGAFMEPGRQMTVTVELLERNGNLAVLKGKGAMNGNSTVSAKLTLGAYNLADRNPSLRSLDESLIHNLRLHCALLQGNAASKSPR
ncbi:MAG: 3-hydroxyacyl-ACP dehydratase FabZ family protein [Gemmataceae bacterium]